MWFFPFDLVLPYAVDVLGCAAAAATLLTFAQKRMWPMRISAIAANLLFIGYGALGLLYPVLFLHLILLPLNVVRLVQLVQQATRQPIPEPEPAHSILVPKPLQIARPSPPFGKAARPGPVTPRQVVGPLFTTAAYVEGLIRQKGSRLPRTVEDRTR